MRQALHIFRKDVRHLWPNIVIVVAAVAGLSFETAKQAPSLTDPQTYQGVSLSLLVYLLPVAWWALIARLIYGEPPAGDQPFWLTRPYSRKSLLAAKALFIAAFINLPMCVGDAFMLRAYGFHIRPELGGLLWHEVLLTALFVLPVVALCAVTTGFTQLIMSIVVLVLVIAGWITVTGNSDLGAPWFALEWTRSYSAGLLMAASALAIVVWQFARRDTTKSRFAVGGTFLATVLGLSFLPWQVGFALQTRFSRQPVDVSRIAVSLDPNMKRPARAFVYRDGSAGIQLSLRATGASTPLTFMRAEGVTATIEGPDGTLWRSGQEPQRNLRSRDELTVYALLGPGIYSRVKTAPLRIRGSLYLTLYGNPRATLLAIRDQAVLLPTPGVGLCSAAWTDRRRSAAMTDRQIILNCRSAFKSGPDFVTLGVVRHYPRGASAVESIDYPRPASYSPFPADANLIPVSQSVHLAWIVDEMRYGTGIPTAVRAVALEPLAHVRKDFEIIGLRLADLEPESDTGASR